MTEYIIPANSKKSQLYFGIFNGLDLVILVCGVIIEIPFLILIKTDSLKGIIFKLLPIGITIFMLIPIAYYHNIRVAIKELYIYLTSQKKYYWRGWCAKYDGDEQAKN